MGGILPEKMAKRLIRSQLPWKLFKSMSCLYGSIYSDSILLPCFKILFFKNSQRILYNAANSPLVWVPQFWNGNSRFSSYRIIRFNKTKIIIRKCDTEKYWRLACLIVDYILCFKNFLSKVFYVAYFALNVKGKFLILSQLYPTLKLILFPPCILFKIKPYFRGIRFSS